MAEDPPTRLWISKFLYILSNYQYICFGLHRINFTMNNKQDPLLTFIKLKKKKKNIWWCSWPRGFNLLVIWKKSFEENDYFGLQCLLEKLQTFPVSLVKCCWEYCRSLEKSNETFFSMFLHDGTKILGEIKIRQNFWLLIQIIL